MRCLEDGVLSRNVTAGIIWPESAGQSEIGLQRDRHNQPLIVLMDLSRGKLVSIDNPGLGRERGSQCGY